MTLSRRMNQQALSLTEPVSHDVPFVWGLDEVTPKRRVDPGTLRQAQNVEIDIDGGFLTPKGYEAYDGQAAPSAATYMILNVTITGEFSDGDTVTGATTGDTGVIVTGGVVTGGAQDYLVLTKVVGSFDNATEDLQVSAVTEGNVDAVGVVGGASTVKLNAQYKNLAADVYRADIGAIPGEGHTLGIRMLSDVWYGFRNHASKGSVTLTGGGSGSVDGITVNSVQIMSGAVSFDTDLPTTATAVAANINAFTSSPNYTANAVGAKIHIRALTNADTFAVVSSATTITTSDSNMANHGGGAELYKSSSSGWTLVPLGFELAFTSGGTTEIAVGDTITGATGGATAVLTHVLLESGTWAAGTAAGKFIFAVQTGTFQSENINVGASTNLATIAGDSSEITILPDGRYEMINHNFGGQAGTEKIYGCDKVNRGFEFDGTVFAPIKTGMTTDTPNHVAAFKNHLFFAFGGSAQHSGTGTPYAWTVVTGASELALGDTITGFMEQPSDAPPTTSQSASTLSIFSRNRIHNLYGSSSDDWDLAPYRKEVGAYAYSMQDLGLTLFMDDRGVTMLETVQAFGNFDHTAVSRRATTFINTKKTLTTASCIARDKSQYRVFFTDKTALYLTTNGREVIGMAPQLLADEVKCISSQENSSGNEIIMFGSDSGFVYQMEKGTSHDGDNIEVQMVGAFVHSGHPRREKHYQDLSFEIEGSGYAEFTFDYDLGYASSDIPQPGSTNNVTNFNQTLWDSFIWDAFTWDGQTLIPSQVDLDGTAENISLIIKSDEDYFSPILFSGFILHFLWGVELRS